MDPIIDNKIDYRRAIWKTWEESGEKRLLKRILL